MSHQTIESIRTHKAECDNLQQHFFDLIKKNTAAAKQFAEEERPARCDRIEQSSSGDGKFSLRGCAGQYQPMLEVLALIKCNGAGSQRSARLPAVASA